MPVEWNDRRFKWQLHAAVAAGMHAGTSDLVGQVKQLINIQNVDGQNPSKPGQPPHRDTHRLWQSITNDVETEPNGVTGRVGTNVEYAKELEFGTSEIAARPWLRRSLRDNATRMNKVFTRTALRMMRRAGVRL